jgi:hypothetical protein
MVRSTFRVGMPAVGVALVALAYLPLSAFAMPHASARDDQRATILTAKAPGGASQPEAAKAQYAAAAETLDARYREFLGGRGASDILLEAADSLRDVGLRLAGTRAEEVAFLERVLDLAQKIEKRQRQRFEAGRIPRREWEAAHGATSDAESRLQAKRKAKPAPQ